MCEGDVCPHVLAAMGDRNQVVDGCAHGLLGGASNLGYALRAEVAHPAIALAEQRPVDVLVADPNGVKTARLCG
jgi:hypothetical protein